MEHITFVWPRSNNKACLVEVKNNIASMHHAGINVRTQTRQTAYQQSRSALHAVQRRIWRWHECDIELDFQSVSVASMPVLFRVAMNAFASESGDHEDEFWDRTAYYPM